MQIHYGLIASLHIARTNSHEAGGPGVSVRHLPAGTYLVTVDELKVIVDSVTAQAPNPDT
jgi:hypothetical protein